MTTHITWLDEVHLGRFAGFGKANCEIGWNWSPPPLVDYDLWYVVAGKGELMLEGRRYPLRKGRCFLVRPGDRPAAKQDPMDRLTVIYIHFSIAEKAGPVQPDALPPRCTDLEDPYFFEMLLHRMLHLLYYEPDGKEQELDYVLKLALLQLYREHARAPDPAIELPRKQKHLVGQLIAYMREEGGRRIPHRELADRVGLSPQYVSAMFKKHTGTSLKQYMTRVRMERAAHLLAETSMNVTQVAEALHYTNIYLFSRQFKQHHGCPPSRFLYKSAPTRTHSGTPQPGTEAP
ncbi:helix-turn-helix transcriptional regulator [Paenibacillus sp. IB182496]|uniref:Helix-turn-helix transcriptional regulator n=1 Tax=Paenibacillus sabuli TaxID=2772509 RepID=A0A927BUD6_9BACL|nr:AraC family transcriptional regulator [Paenibacillus sabuli]MBD2847003.1 helix-turn-helix transcriptional regulator [Paenibacillus sabuli]